MIKVKKSVSVSFSGKNLEETATGSTEPTEPKRKKRKDASWSRKNEIFRKNRVENFDASRSETTVL